MVTNAYWFCFPPLAHHRVDFYFRVILPSVTYGLIVWGSCGKTMFSELEKIHVRAAKIIHNLDWYTPSVDVLAQVKWNTINFASST